MNERIQAKRPGRIRARSPFLTIPSMMIKSWPRSYRMGSVHVCDDRRMDQVRTRAPADRVKCQSFHPEGQTSSAAQAKLSKGCMHRDFSCREKDGKDKVISQRSTGVDARVNEYSAFRAMSGDKLSCCLLRGNIYLYGAGAVLQSHSSSPPPPRT
jgi:hypothetical protein